MAERARIGFIGTGIMGQHMARNLLKAGFPLVVHNRTRARIESLVAEGATPADSPAALAAQCDFVFSCVPKPPDVERVYLGADGVVAAARPGSVLCDMSTIDPDTHRRIAALAAARDVEYLDAPVSGGPSGARDATLAIMVGGTASGFDRTKPYFDAMGKHIYHVGPVGAGATVKLINQMMGAIAGLAAVEGLVLGTKAGIDPQLLLDIVSNSSGMSRMLLGMGPNILKRDFEPGFTVDYLHKDVYLAVNIARSLGVRVLAGALAEQVLQEAKASGLAPRGMQAVVQPLERLAQVEVRASTSAG